MWISGLVKSRHIRSSFFLSILGIGFEQTNFNLIIINIDKIIKIINMIIMFTFILFLKFVKIKVFDASKALK